jgi:1-pyrroline-4-hydroxy-2-carboxylate deaminase
VHVKSEFTRRECLRALAIATSAAALSDPSFSAVAKAAQVQPLPAKATTAAASQAATVTSGDAKIQGLFLIPSTPYTSSGAVSYEDLATEAKFMDWCGVNGIVWPQATETVAFLTKKEKFKGMEVLTKANQGLKTVLCLGVNGKDTEEMLEFARHAESLAPAAIVSRPPDSGTSQQDILDYYRALGKVVKRPVIIQTTGGYKYKGPPPSVETIEQLASEFPWFGYVKEETSPLYPTTDDRMRSELHGSPVAHDAASPRYMPVENLENLAGGLKTETVRCN